MSLTEALIDFAPVVPPDDARAVMRLSVLDWAACGMAGHASGEFDAFVAAQPAEGACTTFDEGRFPPASAALINGTLSHALDYDDTHFDHIGHTSVAVLPAALAAGEHAGARLSDIIDAALVGSEAAVAIGLWLGRDHYQVGFHQTATAGSFGAALAAGRLLGLSSDAMRHALGLTSTMASGLKSQFGTMGKPLNAGLAARTGVEAALWAEAGMTSAADGLSGPQGFGVTHHGAAEAAPLPSAPWRMCRVSHKLHACCHGLHAALNAAAGVDLKAARVITVRTHPRWLSVCNIPAPETGLASKFSYAQVLAMQAHGIATNDIRSFSDETAKRADLAAFRTRVEVVADAKLSEWQAVLVVDGTSHHADLETPMDTDRLTALLQDKAKMLVADRAAEVWRAIQQDDLTGFLRSMRPPSER